MKTAESVTPKHPDKMCDQISDAILDLCLKTDPGSRAAIEVMGGHGEVYITGELTSKLGFRGIDAREIVKRITGDDRIEVIINIAGQSEEIAGGVDTGGAGDQGIMIGYACRDNEAMIPQEAFLARSLAKFLYEIWPNDGKTQITLDDNGLVHTIVASFQGAEQKELTREIMRWVDNNEELVRKGLTIHANPAGDWNKGGFDSDTGLTGRKLMVDNYGPKIPIGGGAFSGKDATKVDRSAAYMARKIAVDILNQHPEAQEACIEIAYAIGIPEPVGVIGKIISGDWELIISDDIKKQYDLTPKGIIKTLDLRKPIFEETAKWGHFGNGFLWG